MQIGVVDIILLAGLANFVLVVKILGQITADAGLVIFEGPSSWTDAALERCVVLLALLAVRT